MRNANVTADLSTCNGTCAFVGQHKACLDRDDNEITWSVIIPSVPPSKIMRPCFVLLTIAYDAFDASLAYTSHDVVLFWQPPSAFYQRTSSPFIGDFVQYKHTEQFMIAAQVRLFSEDLALSAILTTNYPRKQKCLGRRVVCHFDHDPWQKECEHIALRENLVNLSRNNEMRLALACTGHRRVAKTSPHDRLLGIGLGACDQHASSPDTWCGLNSLG